MSNPKNFTTRRLEESVILIVLSIILSLFSFRGIWTEGARITACSLLPLAVISWRYGCRWGTFTAFLHGLIQALLGISHIQSAGKTTTIILVILLDYVLAYSVIGLAAIFKGRSDNPAMELIWGIAFAFLLRFVCRFLSGVWVWNVVEPNEMGWSAPFWAFLYNASAIAPELILTMFVATVLYMILKKYFQCEDLK